MTEHWIYRGDGPPRWITNNWGGFWYLTAVQVLDENGTARYHLGSHALKKDLTVEAPSPETAQAMADTMIRNTLDQDREERARYLENRVWVVTYRDPQDSTYVGVWGVYRTADRAGTEADACENAERTHVEVSEHGLDYLGTQD